MASRITQSFAFHQAPESFIFDRLQRLGSDGDGRPTVTAEILNRNVHIVSSYKLCKEVLTSSGTTANVDTDTNDDNKDAAPRLPADIFAAGPAYEQLMAAFFPPPNVLLQDGEVHREKKNKWRTRFGSLVEDSVPLVRHLTQQAFSAQSKAFLRNQPFDLYEALKGLAWDLLLGIFLGLRRDSDRKDFAKMESLQEDLLRGQFSLFPVALSVPFWSSARSRGLKAVKNLEPTIKKHLQRQRDLLLTADESLPQCPFAHGDANQVGALSEEETVSHVRLFTSSIANKALASLLTAYFMNIFLWRDGQGHAKNQSLANVITSQQDPDVRQNMLRSVLYETARLSPPVIGVMRRATQTVDVSQASGSEATDDHSIAAGHDAWLYFAAANRDPAVFHKPADFCWDRYMSHEASENYNLAFGAGAKQCLGADLTYQICLTVMQTVLDSGLAFEGKVEEAGVREWLGWQHNASPEAMARDLKQLPCQRPRRPVTVVLHKV